MSIRSHQLILPTRHLLTRPYSPATTGKVERLHKTMRAEFFRQSTAGTQFSPGDRAFLAALLHWLPRDLLGRIRLVHPQATTSS